MESSNLLIGYDDCRHETDGVLEHYNPNDQWARTKSRRMIKKKKFIQTKVKRSNWKSKVHAYIKDFGESTTLHGIRYITNDKLHFSERIMWLVIFVVSAYAAGSLILNNWGRYVANPTVMSLEKNFRDWYIVLPASTVCFLDRLNETLAEEFILEKWNVEPNTTEFNLYKSFLNSVVNISYENLDEFSQYLNVPQLTAISGEEMAEIARQVMVQMQFHATIFNSVYKNTTFYETLTEMGICYTYAGIIPNYISLVKNPKPDANKYPFCNYLNSLCYARIEDLPAPIKYYIHSGFEIPDSSDKFFIVLQNMERDTSFRSLQTVASDDLYKLQPKQRNCRFMTEPEGSNEVYSYNLCRMGCRKRLAYQYCGCAPYFYLKEDGIPVCGVRGLACLASHTQYIVRLRDANDNKITCDCYLQCLSVSFYLDKNNERKWAYPVPANIRYRWAIDHYSKTRFKRDIIFGFEDLLVSLGGTAALFLGCSVLSFVEIFYFLTLRLFWYIKKYN